MKEKKSSFPLIISIIYGLGIVCSLPFVVMSPMLFDAPGSTNNVITWVFVCSILLTPVCFLFAIIIGNIKKSKFFLIGLIGPLLIIISIIVSIILSIFQFLFK